MKTLHSWKSEPIKPKGTSPDLILVFDQPVGKANPWPESGTPRPERVVERRYQREARRLVDALVKHLPGGLFSALFAVICERMASAVIVPDIPESSRIDPEEAVAVLLNAISDDVPDGESLASLSFDQVQKAAAWLTDAERARDLSEVQRNQT